MKLVLVAGMNPRVNKRGPVVKLYAGWWKLCVENRKDCDLSLHTERSTTPFLVQDGYEFESTGGNFSLSAMNGTEDYINVFAESINGPVSTATP